MIFHFRELVSGSWSCARWLIRTFDGSWAVVKEICFTCLFPSKTSQSDCSENDLRYNKNDKRYDTCYLLNRKNTKWIFSFGVCWLAHISQVQQNIQTFNYSKAHHILQKQRTAECVFGSCSCMEGMKKNNTSFYVISTVHLRFSEKVLHQKDDTHCISLLIRSLVIFSP